MFERFDLDKALAIVHAATEHTARYVPGMRVGQLGRHTNKLEGIRHVRGRDQFGSYNHRHISRSR